MIIALIGFAAVLILAFLRMPLGVALGLVGLVGFSELSSYRAGMSNAARLVIDSGQSYGLSVVPLFILMGLMVDRGGMAKELYRAAYAFLGHRRGGLAMSTIVACGMFSAICGSSLATAATMSKVSMPEMRRYKYDDSLATASIAAGGTLGILIPPSVILVIYGLITNASVGKLFIAGVLPGIIGVLFYLAAVMFVVSRNPAAGPAGEKTNGRDRLIALRDVWTTLGLFIFVIGGIYVGAFTPTEAAGMGAAGAIAIAYFRGALSLQVLLEVARETTMTTAKLFLVVFGAMIFSNFVNRAGLPDGLLNIAQGFDFPPLGVIFMILLIYLVLGCVFESLSMILLTVPIFAPLVEGLGFDLIWFGILVVVATEISLITPPIGMNVFVLKGVLKDVSVKTIFKGVTPFWIADIFRITLIALVPAIALLLPSMMQ
ncbi:MAG: TRAP transporter large permease [Amylibacter sp.]|jgi:C4-dicarboxylate transporter, DctM subunit|nr:TRAP transporter large permease [Amylibacter sp.]MDG1235498.1 TRAP transporter large permease [Amylibacter sp.]MDG1997751.1 TRAP transporter large permease [Amylibacter sp.]|tara:strand:+ start:5385 stop:6677 length:1293 start_codon:yes stop_codon:yes gene_type:complete